MTDPRLSEEELDGMIDLFAAAVEERVLAEMKDATGYHHSVERKQRVEDSVRARLVASCRAGRADTTKLQRFAAKALDAVRGQHIGNDWDGSDVQDALLECGLLAPVRVEKACGEDCECAAWDDFPQDCLRMTDLAERCVASLATPRTPSPTPDV